MDDIHELVRDLSIKALVHQQTLSHMLSSFDEAALNRMHEDIAAQLEAADKRPDAIGPAIGHLDVLFSMAGALHRMRRPPPIA
jgi:NAD(P)-dependent dehydrogenase (short-subunit alcohol dehydrogenase family)